MARTAAIIRLTEEERNILNEWSNTETAERKYVERARIILLSSEDYTVEEIAQRLQTRPSRVSKWRQRFDRRRLFGLSDFQRSGAPSKYDDLTEKRVLDLLEQPPPEGHAQWNGRLLAAALGDVNQAQVWRILRRREVHLTRRHSWSIKTEPEFAPKAMDIVGLYLNPPESGLVLYVADAPQIQRPEAVEASLRLTNGKIAKNFTDSEEPDRAITLSEALEVMTARVQAGHAQHRCRRQFLDFMDDVLAAWRDQQIHAVLNHPDMNKPKWDRWLRKQRRVRLHFTPTVLSWLNQVECWFSILSGALPQTNSPQPRRLREAIESFVGAYHDQSAPFEWVKIPVPLQVGSSTH